MDRPATCALDHPTAVRTAESAALDLLLPAAAGERREPAPDAAARRAVSGMSLLRQPPHGGHAGGEPQTRPAAHGDYGNRSSLSETELEPPGAGSRDLPIPAARPVDRAAHQGWNHHYYYFPDGCGFLFLVAVMDWFSRFVLSWELSNTMETGFCLAAQEAAFRFGQPEIWNSDQGSPFPAADFLASLKKRGVRISMDGRGRALDNVFIERLWRSLKYELIYPGDFATGLELFPALDRYFHFYNYQRPHQALGYCSPAEMFPLRSKRTRPS